MRAGHCDVCQRLSPTDLLELDALVGDPTRWPSTIWSFFSPPANGLPASYRRFGAMRVGRDWLDGHGWGEITNQTLRRHIRYDVPHVAVTPDELVKVGLIRSTSAKTGLIPVNPALDAGAVIRYFNAGIQMGEAALRLTAERINRIMAEGGEPDPKLVLKLADLGSKLAVAQASLQTRGAKFTGEVDDEDDAFRGSDVPGQRIGAHRSRTIEGEVRMVQDKGPADRERYNERAREEGSPVLD